MIRRWLTFNVVGLLGFGLQIGLLVLLVKVLGLHYLPATFLAVAATVTHNFFWHERWTWRERRPDDGGGVLRRWLAFNVSNGAVSLVGNVLLMKLLVGVLGLPLVVGNLASVGVCALVNFVLSDRVVFAVD